MKRERMPIPKPRSAFLLIRCTNCGNEQVVFSSTTMDIKCRVCDAILSVKTGGKSDILGIIVKRLD